MRFLAKMAATLGLVVTGLWVANAPAQAVPAPTGDATVYSKTCAAGDYGTANTYNNYPFANGLDGTTGNVLVVNPGETYTCRVWVRNPTNTAATNIGLVENNTSPDNFVREFHVNPAISCPGQPAVGSSGPITCNIASLAAFDVTQLNFVFTADPNACGVGENRVTLTDGTTAPNEAPDTARSTIIIDCNQPSPGTGPCTIDFRTSTTSQTIYGTPGNDVICGSPQTDYIYASGGHDIVFGGGGTDYIYGEDGNDTLHGGDGTDYLFGGAGNDRLFGENGDDYLDGGADVDTAAGGAGYDYCSAESMSSCP